jgi:hypothetical protein
MDTFQGNIFICQKNHYATLEGIVYTVSSRKHSDANAKTA